jgi:para-nitrobenzyl esterase
MLDRSQARRVAAALLGAAGILLAGCHGGGSTSLPSLDPSVVATDKGSVRGTVSGAVRTFLGIPYAAAPTGANRFMAPQPAAAWTTTFDATKAGSVCPQAAGPFGQLQDTTEDCLNLNVTTPAFGASGLPVLFWIHGGAFVSGSGVYYNAAKLATTGNIVVVTVNYRLGVLGFLASPALDDGTGNTGNYGIEDQQAALRWVKRNIAGFGGDPNNVTIAGESAGALSVCDQLVSPGASGSFARAIVESGPCAAPLATLAQAKAAGAAIASNLGCTGTSAQVVACLRSPSLTVAQILAAQAKAPGLSLGPTAGGSDIPVQPRGGLGKVPLLIGGTQLEMGLFVALGIPFSAPSSEAAYQAQIQGLYGSNGAAILAQYPYSSYPNGFIAISSVLTDYNPVVSLITECYDVKSYQIQGASSAPVYAYEFSEPTAPPVLRLAGFPSGPLHASELPYLFPNLSNSFPNTGPDLPVSEQPLSDAMTRYWTNFVRTGNPNGAGLPVWPSFKANTDALQLSTPIQTGVDVSAEHKCPFWNSIGLAN